jgi:hypothetical protein
VPPSLDPFGGKPDGITVTEFIPFDKSDGGSLAGELGSEIDNVKKKS